MGGGAVAEVMEEMSPEEMRKVLEEIPLKDSSCKDREMPGRGGLSIVLGVGLFSALGGGLFGLDIGYIAGVESMNSFCRDVLDNKPMDSVTTGMVTGIFALGAVVAAFPVVIGWVVRLMGRKGSITFGATVFCVGALAQGLAPNLAVMYVGRFVAGASVGLLSANVPLYQGEIAPPEHRGAVVALYQLAITIGICVAFWINYGLTSVDHGWRYSILAQLIPGSMLAIGGIFMPQSPRNLISQQKYDEALRTIVRIRGPHQDARVELAQIFKEYRREMAHGQPSMSEFFSGTNGKVLLLGVLLQLIQQICGLNLFLYYGPTVFERVFHSANASFFFAAVVGIVNFVATFPALFLVDKAGRTKLLLFSSIGMCISCVVLAVVGDICFTVSGEDCKAPLGPGDCGYDPIVAARFVNITAPCSQATSGPKCGDWAKYTIAGSIFFFIFNFAYGWGPVAWVYCAEIFSLKYKTQANGLTTDANWVGNFLIGFAPPLMMSQMGFATFWIFAGINLIGAAFAFWMPETKGKSLEEVQAMFERKFGGSSSKDADAPIQENNDVNDDVAVTIEGVESVLPM